MRILIILALVGAASAFASWGLWLSRDLGGLLVNVGTELAGAVVAYLLLERIVGGGEEKEEEKARLIGELGSTRLDVAIDAAEKLRERWWLTDGSLQGARLRFANLEGAVLWEANLQGAKLEFANLQRANLREASLEGAVLWEANLQGARLWVANLKGARLWVANLKGASLIGANLKGASLGDANLEGAELENTIFDEDTTLPDDTKWTPETDMERFADPTHPEFWRSDSDYSPAYKGSA